MINSNAGKGFTLLELMMASAVLIVAMAGLLGTYMLCFNIIETSKNLTLATNAIQQEIEVIRDYPFSNIANLVTASPSGFKGATFTVPGFAAGSAIGSVSVNDSNPDLLKITVSVSWRQKSGRIIGEDNGRGGGIALNGRSDGSEDLDGDGSLDSPAEITILMANR